MIWATLERGEAGKFEIKSLDVHDLPVKNYDLLPFFCRVFSAMSTSTPTTSVSVTTASPMRAPIVANGEAEQQQQQQQQQHDDSMGEYRANGVVVSNNSLGSSSRRKVGCY